MRKTMATVVVLGLVWIGYTAWPLSDLFVLLWQEAHRLWSWPNLNLV